MILMMVAMMLLPSLMLMLWRYSARPYDRTGKNPEVLIGFFAKNAISRLQKVLSADITSLKEQKRCQGFQQKNFKNRLNAEIRFEPMICQY
jgi:hypothetical protein